MLEHCVDLEKFMQRPLDLASAEPTTIDERRDKLGRNIVERFHSETPLSLMLRPPVALPQIFNHPVGISLAKTSIYFGQVRPRLFGEFIVVTWRAHGTSVAR